MNYLTIGINNPIRYHTQVMKTYVNIWSTEVIICTFSYSYNHPPAITPLGILGRPIKTYYG